MPTTDQHSLQFPPTMNYYSHKLKVIVMHLALELNDLTTAKTWFLVQGHTNSVSCRLRWPKAQVRASLDLEILLLDLNGSSRFSTQRWVLDLGRILGRYKKDSCLAVHACLRQTPWNRSVSQPQLQLPDNTTHKLWISPYQLLQRLKARHPDSVIRSVTTLRLGNIPLTIALTVQILLSL